MKFVLAFILLLLPCAAYAAPCDKIDRSLTEYHKSKLSMAILNQTQVGPITVLESFVSGSWSIIYFDPNEGDKIFAFYSADPLTNPYVAIWGGPAKPEEEKETEQWAFEHAPGIPKDLAACFAWHITHELKK